MRWVVALRQRSADNPVCRFAGFQPADHQIATATQKNIHVLAARVFYPLKANDSNVFGETPNTARETRALPKDYCGLVKSSCWTFK
jgi:hypothetical protein